MQSPSKRRASRFAALIISMLAAPSLACSAGDSFDNPSTASVGVQLQLDELRQLASQRNGSEGINRQIEMLEDLEVTEAEYREAMNASRDCMERRGLEVSPIWEEQTVTGSRLSFRFEPGSVAPELAGEVADECEIEFGLSVSGAWSAQARTVQPELKAELDECFAADGLTTSAANTVDDYMQVVGSGAQWANNPCVRALVERLAAANIEPNWSLE